MAGSPVDTNTEESLAPLQPPEFTQQKRIKFENGQLVEYWIDVPIEKPKDGASNHCP